MAYRSDVRIVVSNKGYQELKKYVNEHLPEDMKKYNLLQNTDVEKITDNQVYLGWDSIKWYEYADFKEVDTIMAGLKYLDANDYSYCYARIGEQVDDYEEKYNVSDKEDYLDFPQLERYFDDDYFFNKDKSKDVDI